VAAEDVPARAAILQARAAGFTFREIAEQVGISTATAFRLARGGATVDPATQRALEGLEFVESAGGNSNVF
jgi:DNA-directed RNA polymerase specialized sigma24 family protein